VDPPAIGIGGVLPIGTALVTEFASDHDRHGRRGRSAGRRLAEPRCRAIHVDLWLARARTDPRAPPVPRADRTLARVMSPDSKPALLARTGTADAPCFQRVISLFSLCYCFLEKLSKSLIPLSDCPFVLNRLPVFLENLPVSGKKQGPMRGIKGDVRGEAAKSATRPISRPISRPSRPRPVRIQMGHRSESPRDFMLPMSWFSFLCCPVLHPPRMIKPSIVSASLPDGSSSTRCRKTFRQRHRPRDGWRSP
jgi:hypothetical protein